MLSTHIRLFQTIKRVLELVSLPHFRHNFLKEMFLLLCSINWLDFIVWLPLLCKILGNMCIEIVCKPGCDVMNFEVNLIFLIKPLFEHDQKVVTKTLKSWERKELLRWNKKRFSSFSKQAKTQFFGRWETRVRPYMRKFSFKFSFYCHISSFFTIFNFCILCYTSFDWMKHFCSLPSQKLPPHKMEITFLNCPQHEF